jgi:hypothetical protein
MASIISAGTSSGTALNMTGDTSGNLAFQTGAGANTITVPNVTGTILTTGSAGTVLQVLQAVKTSVQSTTSTSTVDVTGLSVTITPKFATSKILVLADVGVGISTATGSISFLWIVRNSTNIYVGDSAGSRTPVWQFLYNSSGADAQMFRFSGNYLDSPATTSATTYKIAFNTNNGAVATYINQSAGDANANYVGRVASSITVMEIAA